MRYAVIVTAGSKRAAYGAFRTSRAAWAIAQSAQQTAGVSVEVIPLHPGFTYQGTNPTKPREERHA